MPVTTPIIPASPLPAASVYRPPGAQTPEEKRQIRLLLHGKPASGKTWAACSFPNPVVVDLDGNTVGLKQHPNYANILIMPFNDLDWVKKTFAYKNQRDALLAWLHTESRKLSTEQTLVLDSLSAWQDMFHEQAETEVPTSVKTGEADMRSMWGAKLIYFRKAHDILKSLRCHVVVTAHDHEIRDDKNGILVTKVGPSMTGSYADQLGRNYTDIYHQECVETKDAKGIVSRQYRWQIRGDSRFDLKTRMNTTEMYIDADFKNIKY